MKKKIALVMAGILLTTAVMMTLTGCVGLFGEIDEDYTGTTLNLYFSDLPTSFDPMYAYIDDSACSVLSLMYEGLYKYDANGKVTKGVADSYKWVTRNAVDGYSIEIKLKHTAWSDGTSVSAHDFVYAWRRILNPGNSSSAAAMLYQIKNAQAVKRGDADVTKYDFGASATEADVIRIDFEGNTEPDLDLFFTYLASPALVPMRDDIVGKIADWDTTNGILLSNGPFYLKSFDANALLRFERNRYYRRDAENDEMDEYVTPYRLIIQLGKRFEYKTLDDEGNEMTASLRGATTGELASKLWEANNIKYYGNIWPQERESLAGSVTTANTKTTEFFYFNLKNPLFQKAEVRRALSMAIDRADLISKTVVYADAAEGMIPAGVANGDATKSTFREKATPSLIATDVAEAKNLLKSAGVSGGSFEITVKESDEVATAVANYCAEAWKELGFKVTVRTLGFIKYSDKANGYDNLLVDLFADMFYAGGEELKFTLVDDGKAKDYSYSAFDVILVDMMQAANDPFSTLAPFSKIYSGGGIDLSVQQKETILVPHITGYDSDDYDTLVDSAFKAETKADRASYLHQAEEKLLQDMPVIPLFVYRNSYVKSDDIKGLSSDWYGNTVFTKMSDKTFKYVPGEEAEE